MTSVHQQIVFLILSIFSTVITIAQQSLHPPTLSVHFTQSKYPHSKTSSGLAFQFTHPIKPKLDYSISISGSFPDTPTRLQPAPPAKSILLQSDYIIRARIFTPEKKLQPYLSAGIGLSYYRDHPGIYTLIGAGLQWKIFPEGYILLNVQYRPALTNTANHNLFYSIGLAGNIGKAKRVPQKTSPPPIQIKKPIIRDRDNDGIADTADACPDQPGLAIFGGCPDTDKDGIPDKDDACPQIYGYLKYKGCPPPDSDNDGINDENDSCPHTPGFKKYNGCPVPDTDHDGINDEQDSCINTPGIAELHGCPPPTPQVKEAISFAAKNIFFETGHYQLLPTSYPALDTVVNILKANPMLKLVIEGHTDNVGADASNKLLSQNRAKTIFEYLVAHGIHEGRLQSFGYGEERPVAPNTSANGRARNRRVEMIIQ